MATRNEKLNRLTISSPCQESWDGMTGDGAGRHCARCDRQVFDFAGMTPRQIEARIEATGGRLCARITRSIEGQVITLPPPSPPFDWNERRASPIAAALVTAFLGFGSAASEAAPEPVTEISAAPDRAPAPQPAVETKIANEPASDNVAAEERFAGPMESVTAGVILATPEPLHREFEESQLVVIGVAGASVAIDPNEPSEVVTELKVTTVFKGRFTGRTLRLEHWASDDDGRFLPGTRILALLKPGDPRPGQAPTYVSADYNFGLKVLPEAESNAYGERLSALARIDRKGGPHPADLAEWLVATVEEPLTRKEATDALQTAFDAIAGNAAKESLSSDQAADRLQAEYANRLAEGKSISDEDAVRFVGAFLTDAQRGRLTRSLLATQDLQPADFALYEIVSSWSRDEALDWLIRWFKATKTPGDYLEKRVMERLALDLDNATLKTLVAKANAKLDALQEKAFSDDGAFGENMAKFEADSAAIQKELRRRFLQALDD